jgi:hypothetical protein
LTPSNRLISLSLGLPVRTVPGGTSVFLCSHTCIKRTHPSRTSSFPLSGVVPQGRWSGLEVRMSGRHAGRRPFSDRVEIEIRTCFMMRTLRCSLIDDTSSIFSSVVREGWWGSRWCGTFAPRCMLADLQHLWLGASPSDRMLLCTPN